MNLNTLLVKKKKKKKSRKYSWTQSPRSVGPTEKKKISMVLASGREQDGRLPGEVAEDGSTLAHGDKIKRRHTGVASTVCNVSHYLPREQ